MKTLAELEACEKAFLTPDEVAPIIGYSAVTLRRCARENPEMLGFPVMCLNSRVKIPRLPFLKYVKGETMGDWAWDYGEDEDED